MKRIFFLFFAFYLASSGYTISQTWTRLQGWGLDLETVYWINDSVAFAGGENLLIKTQNRAQTWQELPFQFEGKVTSIAFVDENTGIAVGENGLALKTENSGQTWRSILISSGLDLFKVSPVSESTWMAVGANGAIFRSQDNGETWQARNSGKNQTINDVFRYNSDTLFLAGDGGTLLRSADQGLTYQEIALPTAIDLNGVAFSSPLIGYLVGDEGLIIKTIDGGESWSTLNSGVATDLQKVAISPLDSRIVTVIGDGATALRSINSGASFGRANLGATNTRNLKELFYVPASNLVYAVGQDGYMISSTNAGASYTQRMAGVRTDFTQTDFKTDRYGLLGGKNGSFFVTSNAGLSIISRPLPLPEEVSGMSFWNGSFGYVSTIEGKVFRTTNAGSSWLDLSPNIPEAINGFYLFATSVLYASGNEGRVISSFNSGANWNTQIQSDTENNLKEIMFFDFQFGIAVGENGQISYSNGGATWTTLPSLANENFNALAKLDEENAIVVGDGGKIFKTSDKALTWKEIEVETTEDLLDVDFFDNNVGFIAGKNGLTMQTGDGGETWLIIPSGTSRDLNSISAANPLVAYTVGDDGTFLSYSCIPPEGSLSAITGAGFSCLNVETYSILDPVIEGAQLVWRVDGGKIVSGQGTSQVEIEWTNPGRNGVFVSRRNFCGSGETSFMEVLVDQIPIITNQIVGEGSVCLGEDFSYSLPGLNGVNYEWTATGGEIINGQGTSSILVRWSEEGSQELKMKPSNTCGEGEEVSKPILVKSQALFPGEINGGILVAPGEEVYTVSEVNESSYVWAVVGDGARIIEGQGSASIRVAWEQEGDYQIEVRSQNACGFSSVSSLSVQVSLITGVEPNERFELMIYPNPSSGVLYLESESLSAWNSVEIINQTGQSITKASIGSSQNLLIFQDLPRGVLFLRLKGRNSVVTRKVIVE